jgi:uncharacterized membrane protein HdeD (DUF308 family)
MVRLSSRSLLWRGLLGIAIGIIAIAWPGVTVGAVVLIFAVLVFSDSLIQLFRAFETDDGWQIVGHILLGLIDIAAGVVALAWPGITAEVLTIWIGIWAIVIGGGEFVMAFGVEGTAGDRLLFGLTGVISVALGAVLLAHPDEGAVALAEVFGLFSLAFGISSLMLSFSLREREPGELGRDPPRRRAVDRESHLTASTIDPMACTHATTLVACGHGGSAVGRGDEVVRTGDSLPVRPEMHA